MENLLWFLFIGLVVGWLAGVIVKGSGFGVVADILVGIVGGLFGGWMAGILGLSAHSAFGSFLVALLGAVALVGLIRLVKTKSA